MNKSCTVWTWWRGGGNETPEECAQRTLVLLEELARIDPVFTRFRTTSRKRGKYVRSPLPLDLEGLAALFAKGVNRRDTDRTPITELGYTLYTITPGDSRAGLTVNGGCSGTPNRCVLNSYFEGEDYERIVNVPVLTRILGAMVKAFEPDVGGLFSSDFEDAIAPPEERRDELSPEWLMYFSREWGTVPPLPAPVRMEPLGDGVLVILSPERVSASNPEDVELGRRVRGLLDKAGLLNKDRFDSDRPAKQP